MPESPIESSSGAAHTRGTPPRVSRGRRNRASFAAILLLPQLAGCYQYVAVTAPAPAAGAQVSVGVTDRGRVALTETLGPEVRRVEGRVLEGHDTAVVLSVARVRHLSAGAVDQWAGERVSLSRDFVAEIRERRFSRSRTLLASGAAVAVLAVVSRIAIRGFGDDSGSTRPGGGEPGQQ